MRVCRTIIELTGGGAGWINGGDCCITDDNGGEGAGWINGGDCCITDDNGGGETSGTVWRVAEKI